MSARSVLLINRVYPPHSGATGRLLQDLSQTLVKEGFDVSILTTGDKKEEIIGRGIITIKMKAAQKPHSALIYCFIWLKLLIKGLFLKRHDIIITLTDPPLLILAGRLISKIKHSKHIHWCHDVYPDLLPDLNIKAPKAIYNVFFRQTRNAMNACDQVVVIGRCMSRYLRNTGVKQNLITIIPNWADKEIARRNKAQKNQEASEKNTDKFLKYDVQKFRVLYAGNVGRAHPVGAIIKAASLISDYPEIEFVFVSDPQTHIRLARERDRLGLQNIKLLPYQPAENLKELMESGDVHLVSMKSDAAGKLVPCKFYSALASARPVIFLGPEGTEVTKIIKDFRCGMHVSETDPTSLAKAVLHYRMNGEEWFGAHEGAARAYEIYTPSASLESWVKKLHEVAKN